MRTKRFLAAFLALCLSLALLPSGVIAVESEAEAELPAPEYQQLEAAQSDLEDREESVEALLDVAESPAMPMGETLTYGDLYYTVSGNIITITGCADGVTSLTIPAQIDGKSVTAIANYAFDGCNSLMKLTIPEGVTDLGYYMIRGTAISSITIPSTVTTSGCYYYNDKNGALAGCTTLNTVIFAQGTTKIPDYICASNSNNSHITSIVIPDSVKIIGSYAFYCCSQLSGQVSIPRSIQTIGAAAFAGCTALTSISIPEGTLTVEDYAFEDCSGVTSLEIGKTVKIIGEFAFYNCTALQSVKTHYNSTVEWSGSIGDYAFAGCTSLTDVELAGSYKELGNYLFDGCNSLMKLTIPEGVTDLGYYMIRGTAISSITIPSTVTTSGCYYYNDKNGALAGCTTLNTVIFAQGTTKIPDYICASESQNSYIQSVYIPPTVQQVGNYAFYNCNQITIYCKDNSYAKQYAIDNNIPFILGDFDYGKPQNPVATTGVIQSVTMSRGGVAYNLLTTRQTFEKDSDEQVYVTVVVDWDGAPSGKILLSQGAKKYLQANDGNFGAIKPGKYFDTGEPIYAIAVDGNGNTLESKKVLITVTEPVTSGNIGGDEQKVQIFSPLTFTIPDDKPVLGNTDFKIDLGFLSETIELDSENGTFKAVIGVNLEKDEETGKIKAEDFTDLKTIIKTTKEKIAKGKSAAAFSKYYQKKGEFHSIALTNKWKPSGSICGYIEGKYENGQYYVTEGGLIATAELKYTYEGQTFVWVIPVYYSINSGGELEVTLGIKGMVPGPGAQPMFTGNVKFSPFAEIGGGIGVVYLGQVGARGKVTLNINIALDRNYQKVDLTGQAYFEIKALCFTLYEREFAKGTWTIYETGRNNNQDASLQSAPEEGYASIDIHAPVTPEDRSYANTPTEWLGETPQADLLAADYTNKELRVLQTNAYPDAKPQLMEVDGTKVMVWLTDNTSRTAVNKSMLVYSVYIDAYDMWSTPRAIMDNGRGDYYPVAKDGYVVWQKANREFDTSATLAQVAQSMELYIAHFNGTNFDTPQRLTNNDAMDAQPHIAVDGEQIELVWTRNTDNNILGMSGTNSIHRMHFDGSAWSGETQLVGGLNVVAFLNVGYMDGVPVVAYVLDGDNDLNTVEDREIYLIRNGRTERFTNNDVIDSNPVFEEINGVPALFWYSDFNVFYVTDLDHPVYSSVSADGIEQLTDDYSVVSNGNSTAVLWTTVQDGISEVHGALYDGSQWSQDVEITETGEAARYPNGTIEEDGKLLIAFTRIQNVVDGDYYKDGQADLCVIGVTPSYDIAISDVFVDDGLAPNMDLPVYLTVTNTGELPVQSISVDVKDVDGAQNGHFDFEETLQPGESMDLTLSYRVGNTVKAGALRLTVSTSDGEEYNAENNTATVEIGQSDMEIEDVSCANEQDSRKITVKLKNAGYSKANNVVVTLRDAKGGTVAEQTLSAVSAQETKTLRFTVDANKLAAEGRYIVLTASVSSNAEDANLGNNEKGFVIEKGSQSPNPQDEGSEYTITGITPQNGKVSVQISGTSTQNGVLYVAAYTEDGRMLCIVSQAVSAADIQAGEITVDLDTGGAASVSAFLLRDDGSMRPLATKKTQEI